MEGEEGAMEEEEGVSLSSLSSSGERSDSEGTQKDALLDALQRTANEGNRGEVYWEVMRLMRTAPQALREDREVVMQAVGQFGGALEYAEGGLREDREVVMQAVRQDGR
eukprot:COSAG02_NODE_21605_length_781_cov_3.519062_1_plen_108_part_10